MTEPRQGGRACRSSSLLPTCTPVFQKRAPCPQPADTTHQRSMPHCLCAFRDARNISGQEKRPREHSRRAKTLSIFKRHLLS